MHEFPHPIRLFKSVGWVFFALLVTTGKLPFFTFTALIRVLTLPLMANNNLRPSEKVYTPWADTIVYLAESALLKEETS